MLLVYIINCKSFKILDLIKFQVYIINLKFFINFLKFIEYFKIIFLIEFLLFKFFC